MVTRRPAWSFRTRFHFHSASFFSLFFISRHFFCHVSFSPYRSPNFFSENISRDRVLRKLCRRRRAFLRQQCELGRKAIGQRYWKSSRAVLSGAVTMGAPLCVRVSSSDKFERGDEKFGCASCSQRTERVASNSTKNACRSHNARDTFPILEAIYPEKSPFIPL